MLATYDNNDKIVRIIQRQPLKNYIETLLTDLK
jgi:hypothetical protein